MAIQPKTTNAINVDTIGEKTAAAGVTIDGLLIKDGALGADTVTFATIRGATDTYLRTRNAANSADLSLLKSDGSDNTVLNAATSKQIQFAVNGTGKQAIDSSGNFVPLTTNTYTLGTTALEYATIYTAAVTKNAGALALTAGSGNLNLIAGGANSVQFTVNGTLRAGVNSTGLAWGANNTYDIGTSSTRTKDIWVAGSIKNQAGNVTLAPQSSGDVILSLPSSNFVIKDGSTTYLTISHAGYMQWAVDSTSIATASGFTGTATPAGYIQVSVNGNVRYIRLYSAISAS